MRVWIPKYLFVFFLIAAAVVVTRCIPTLAVHHAFDLFYAAVALGAFYGGLGPGLMAAALSVLAIDFFILPPLNTFSASPSDIIRLAFFFIVAILTSTLSAQVWRGGARLRQASSYPMPAANHEALFKQLILGLTAGLLAFSPLLIKPFAKLKGIGLNGRAWRSTFLERHIPLPSQEPREGYWGSKMPKASYDPDIGPIAPETHIPGMVDVDRFGRQYAFSSPKPQGRLLILGASVAFGAYASSESQTYFHKLALRLGRMHHPAEIIVQATGGWTSVNELAAFKKLGIPLHPDYVIVLDGMNDMMLLRDRPEEQRVREYLEHMKQLRDIALAHGIKVVFSPQPFLPEKDVKSPLEVIIQSESYYPLRRLVGAWAQLRQGVNALAVPGKAFVVDCTDIYDNVQRTIFADIWHFSDFGQARLARYMAWKLDAILRGQAVPVGDIPPRSIPGF